LQRWIKFLVAGIENIKAEGGVGAKDGWTKGRAVVDELKELSKYQIYIFFYFKKKIFSFFKLHTIILFF
jgi:hypothetical protein